MGNDQHLAIFFGDVAGIIVAVIKKKMKTMYWPSKSSCDMNEYECDGLDGSVTLEGTVDVA